MSKEIKVGINYFSGWWRQEPNKYFVAGRDWRHEFAERIPLLGCYNDAETMDAEICAAADYGVDFFQILWYVEKPERHALGSRLNDGLRHFINSPQAHRMSFCIEFCNHPPFEIPDESQWRECCAFWADIMLHPSYLRLDGKAVIKIHGYDYFKAQCQTLEKYCKFIDILRETAAKAGAGELLIGVGATSMSPPPLSDEPFYSKIDWAGTYMWVPDLPITEELYPYETLLGGAEGFASGWKNSPLPYVPYIPSGWDPRPWKDARASFENPSREQFKAALLKVKYALENYPALNINGSKMFTMYAWNEFGEGGYIAPTVGEGYAKLEMIKNVFG